MTTLNVRRLTASLACCLLFAPAAADAGGAADPAGAPADDCGWLGVGTPPVAPDIAQRLAAYAPTRIEADLSHLPQSERHALQKLVDAAAIMDELFAWQATPCLDEMRARLATLPGAGGEAARLYFDLNAGPWDRRLDRAPFVGDWPHPAGANYYPLDLSAQEQARIVAGEGRLAELTTMVRRGPDGGLVAVPYSQHFAAPLARAAALLREAAEATGNASLRAFLLARADAFLTDDYFASDMLWMDLDSEVEITIGPYETYEDGLLGLKAAFEAFVTVVDPQESARLDRFKAELPWLEANLPIPDQHKNPNRGSESPIRVADEVFTAGDTRAGVQTIAFNLPNDERVREAKGSKKVLLRNVMDAKFAQILSPIGARLLDEGQAGLLAAESFFLHTLFHEMGHGLGPGRIVIDGRETEVRLELKEIYATLEEAKADLLGAWTVHRLQGKGHFPPSLLSQQAATYLAGLFRSVRFGIGEAHGQANAMQFNYLIERRAIIVNPDSGRFQVVEQRFWPAVEALLRKLLMVQALGDYGTGRELIERYGGMPEALAEALAQLDGIPVDIRPLYAVSPQP